MDPAALKGMRIAFYARLLREPLDAEGMTDAAVYKLLIDKMTADFNTKARRYLHALAGHHDIPIAEAIIRFVDEHEGAGAQDFSFIDVSGKEIALSTPPLKLPGKLKSANFIKSVTGVGTHSGRYVNASSSMAPVHHQRRDKDLLAVHGDAQLSRYADILIIPVGDENLLNVIQAEDAEGFTPDKLRGSNRPEARLILHLAHRLSEIYDEPVSDVLEVLGEVGSHYRGKAAASEFHLSGVSESDSKPWSLPTVILPGEGQDVQVSIIASHQVRTTALDYKFHIETLERAFPKKFEPDLILYVENGPDAAALAKAAGKKGFEDVTAYVASMLNKHESAVLGALQETPMEIREALTLLDENCPGDGTLEERAHILINLKLQVSRVRRIFSKSITVFTQPQNAYKSAQGTIILAGRAPYFFYRKGRPDTAWGDYLDGKSRRVLIRADGFINPFRRLTMLSFEGALRVSDEGEAERSGPAKGIVSGKQRREAVNDFADGVFEAMMAGLAPFLNDLDEERVAALRRKLADDDTLMIRSAKAAIRTASRRGGRRVNDETLERVFGSRDVIGHLADRAKTMRRALG